MEDLNKKVLISIELANQDAKSGIDNLKASIDALNTSVKENKDSTENATDALTNSKLEQQQVRTEIDKLRLANMQSKKQLDAATGSYNEAAKKLKELGNAIKTAENGFKSTDPAIQKQIKDYADLNQKLKDFNAQMGNHQGNVGNYEKSLTNLENILGKIIPGFSGASSAAKSFAQIIGFMPTASKKASGGVTSLTGNFKNSSEAAKEAGVGFKNFETGATAAGEGATEAEAAVTGLSGASIALIGAFAGVAAVGVGLISYFKDVSTFSDTLSNIWAGLKGSLVQLIHNFGNGNFNIFNTNLTVAAIQAAALNQAMIDLNRNLLVSGVQSDKEDEFIRTQMLKMRQLGETSKQAEDIFNNIQSTAEAQYKRVSKLGEDGFNITANTIKLSADLNINQTKKLFKEGIAAAEEFKKQGLHISDELLGQLAKYQMMRTDAEGIRDQTEQRALNRKLQKEAKNQAAADKEIQTLDQIKRATEQAESERLASLERTLGFQREAFGKELAQTEEHYRQLIFKQEQFIEKQEAIAKSPKSTNKERIAANGAISTGKGAISQLTNERTEATAKLIQDNAKIIQDETVKAANDLKSIQIQALTDVEEKERQSNQLQYNEKIEGLDKELRLYSENSEKLKAQIKTSKGDELIALKMELDKEEQLITISNDKKTELTIQYQKQQKDLAAKFASEKQLSLDQVNVLQAEGNLENNSSLGNEKKLVEAKKEQLLDQRNNELLNESLTAEQKLAINQKYNNDIDALDRKFNKDKFERAIKYEELAKNTAFQIIEQSIASNFQAQQVGLEKQKNYELQNTSLTSTQKYVIEEKARVKEGQLKVKQFRQEQILNSAKALMNGALAITKAYAEEGPIAATAELPFLIAMTAGEEATILAQKPPAYAKGGTFKSDGKGAVLSGYSKTDDTNAYLRSGEAVIVSEAVQNPHARSILSAINQRFGGRALDGAPYSPWFVPGFASGGIYNNYTPVSDNGLRQQPILNSRMHADDINGIVSGISGAIMNMPAPIVDVKDIAYQQNRYAQVTDRLSR